MSRGHKGLEPASYPDYAVVAYVHDGRYAALAAAVAVLHAGGWIKAGRNETQKRDESARGGSPSGFEKSVWLAIHGLVAPGALVARSPVDERLTVLRHACHRRGLIHAFVPVREI